MQKYFFSLLCLCAATLVGAQEKTAQDTTRHKLLPTGLRVGTDLMAIARTQVLDRYEGWEVHADIDFTRYYLAVDYGTWRSDFALDNGSYQNDGTYFRVGADVNFLLKDPDRNMVFLGVRYARSQFSHTANYSFEDAVFGEIDQTVTSADAQGAWREITGGLRVKIWKWVWMGYTARFKFGLNTKGEGDLKAYDVPGYGRTIKPNTWGFNYQLFLRIPVRKEK